ncbi:hypothetical protein Tco_1291914 [Tanacetum coccineum]
MGILALNQNVLSVGLIIPRVDLVKCASIERVKLTRAPGQMGNRLTVEGNRNTRNNRNQVKRRAFNVNAVGALQDPNVVTGTFSLNHHYGYSVHPGADKLYRDL